MVVFAGIAGDRRQKAKDVARKHVVNNAGARTHVVFPLDHVRRFLLIGTDGSTFYVGNREISLQAMKAVRDGFLAGYGASIITEVNEILREGRALRREACLMTLAAGLAYGVGNAMTGSPVMDAIIDCQNSDAENVRRMSATVAVNCIRTPTDMFTLMSYVVRFRGKGRLVRNMISAWFANKSSETLAYQAVKYRQRNGWELRDLLRLSHMPAVQQREDMLLKNWITHRDNSAPKKVMSLRQLSSVRKIFPVIDGFYRAKEAETQHEIIRAIRECNLPWEAIPDEWMRNVRVWQALLENTGVTALVRNLGRLSSIGFFDYSVVGRELAGENRAKVCGMLRDSEYLKRGRIHPIAILFAKGVYASGRGNFGKMSWNVDGRVLQALDDAFFLSFGNVKATGKRIMTGLDVSGSMWAAPVSGSLHSADIAGAMTLVTARVEGKNAKNFGFSNSLSPFVVDPDTSLADMEKIMIDLRRSMSGTDARLLIRKAIRDNIAVDAFVLYTDNEHNGWGHESVTDCLRQYRQKTGIDARLISVAMSATNFSVADTSDPLQMDVVGFDSGTPEMIRAFICGEI